MQSDLLGAHAMGIRNVLLVTGDPRKRILLDEVRAYARQLAFRSRGKPLVERERDDEAEHGIADEFEPLVVRSAVAAVGQRLGEQARIVEDVADRDA